METGIFDVFWSIWRYHVSRLAQQNSTADVRLVPAVLPLPGLECYINIRRRAKSWLKCDKLLVALRQFIAVHGFMFVSWDKHWEGSKSAVITADVFVFFLWQVIRIALALAQSGLGVEVGPSQVKQRVGNNDSMQLMRWSLPSWCWNSSLHWFYRSKVT